MTAASPERERSTWRCQRCLSYVPAPASGNTNQCAACGWTICDPNRGPTTRQASQDHYCACGAQLCTAEAKRRGNCTRCFLTANKGEL